MRKKHVVRLAQFIRDASPDHCEPFTVRQIVYLSTFCQEFNPGFDGPRWVAIIDPNNQMKIVIPVKSASA